MKWLIDLLKALFGRRDTEVEENTPTISPPRENIEDSSPDVLENSSPDVEIEGDNTTPILTEEILPHEEEEPEAPDEPEDAVDDPEYDLENETDDDSTPRDALPEPEPELVAEIELRMVPEDPWKQRQQWLKDLGFDPGPVDGKPGRRTNAAVKAFQESVGLKIDGEWGPKTEKAIRDALRNALKPDAPPPFVPPVPVFGKPKYEEKIGETVLDDAFYACFVDLTHKSNVLDEKGRRRRKGVRKHTALTRICWHQTAFTWNPYKVLKALKKWSSHHMINAHACFDTDGSILLLHNFFYYLWTANSFNTSCLSFEVMGNFEGVLGSGQWYKGDKFGRDRPKRIQIIRARQMILWLLNPEQGPEDSKLPKPLLEWREGCRKHGNPLKWNNTHRESTDDRNGDCGSELWYHVGFWGIEKCPGFTHGPKKGKGQDLPDTWWQKPIVPPLDA